MEQQRHSLLLRRRRRAAAAAATSAAARVASSIISLYHFHHMCDVEKNMQCDIKCGVAASMNAFLAAAPCRH